jgi:succinoglycan biosynthesis transport protein ExoP
VQQSSEALNLRQVLSVLRRRAPWIVLCFVLGAAAAYAVSKRQTKQYTATASVAFSTTSLSNQLAGLPTGTSNPLTQQADDLELLRSGDVAAKTASLLGPGVSAEQVANALSIAARGESSVISVSATTASPVLAARIANIYTGEFVQEQQSADRRYFRSALALVRRQLAGLSSAQRLGQDGLNLQNRAQTLAFLAALGNNTVQLAQQALAPTSPSSPKTSKNVIIGGALGLFVGLGLAFLLEQMDGLIRRPEELQAIYRAPLLGVVPASRALSRRRAGKGLVRDHRQSVEAEAFYLIRAHLRFLNIGRDLRRVIIASPARGEGKTTVAHYLAEAAARHGARVLLLEVDLRDPVLAQRLQIERGPGLADVLIGDVSLAEAIQSIDLEAPFGENAEKRVLDVVVAGAVMPPNPGELLESSAIADLLEQAKWAYDLVVIDPPPLTSFSDAFPLLTEVDGVVMVGWIGRSRRDTAERLHQLLATSGVRVLGAIANGSKSAARPYAMAEDRRSSPAVSANGASPAEQLISAAKT